MNIGDKVKIKECHALPQVVGLEAEVVAMDDPETTRHPIQVVLTGDPVTIQTQIGTGQTKGPFPFREDELELLDPDHGIPDVFKKED